MKSYQWIMTLVAFITLVLVCSCGTATKPAPTPVPLPAKMPPAVQDWDGYIVKTICLKTEYLFPEYNGPGHPRNLTDTTREILTRLGMEVVVSGSTCDGMLYLKVIGKELSGNYEQIGKCFTGAKVEGDGLLTAEGKQPLVFSILAKKDIERAIDDLPGAKDKCGPGLFSFDDLWGKQLVEGLAKIWGPQVRVFSVDIQYTQFEPTDEVFNALIYALEDEKEELRRAAALRLADFAPNGEAAIPYLIQRLYDESYDVREQAAFALGKFGPKAEVAVPRLEEMLREDYPTAFIKHGMEKYISDALRLISGEN